MTDLSRFQTKSGKVIRHGKEIAVEVIQSTTKPKRPWTKVYLREAAVAFKALNNLQAFVWIFLQYMAWKSPGKPFAVSNSALVPYGISRKVKMAALESLEAAGLISLVKREKRAPIVTLTTHLTD
jgi:hypothetical protein